MKQPTKAKAVTKRPARRPTPLQKAQKSLVDVRAQIESQEAKALTIRKRLAGLYKKRADVQHSIEIIRIGKL